MWTGFLVHLFLSSAFANLDTGSALEKDLSYSSARASAYLES